MAMIDFSGKWLQRTTRASRLRAGDEFWHRGYKWQVVDSEIEGNEAHVYCLPSPNQLTPPPLELQELTAFIFPINQTVEVLFLRWTEEQRGAMRIRCATE